MRCWGWAAFTPSVRCRHGSLQFHHAPWLSLDLPSLYVLWEQVKAGADRESGSRRSWRKVRFSHTVLVLVWPQMSIVEREVEDRGMVLDPPHAIYSGNSQFLCVTPEDAARFQMILLLQPALIGPESHLWARLGC